MKLSEAREIIEYCRRTDYKGMIIRYMYGEIISAIRTVEARKQSTDYDREGSNIVFWKIALRPE